MTSQSRRLVCLFTRFPQAGTTKTRMIPILGEQGAADLQRAMTEHIIAAIRPPLPALSSDLEVRFAGGNQRRMVGWLGPDLQYHPQGKGDIGHRMASAFSEAVQRGYEATLVIGSDIPAIGPATLAAAFDCLTRTDIVFGPASDGGYYLVGIRSATVPKAIPLIFDGIAWGSAQVLSTTLERLTGSGLSSALIETLDDVDRPEDLPIWLGLTQSD